jgi:hypothetical protein
LRQTHPNPARGSFKASTRSNFWIGPHEKLNSSVLIDEGAPSLQKLSPPGRLDSPVLCGQELRGLTWAQIDSVGRSKTEADEGRAIPLNSALYPILREYAVWYREKFGETKPEWYVFPFSKPSPEDPSHPITTFRTAWSNVRERAEVKGRWHDNRHTLITYLAESGAGDQTIMDIAGHVSKQMLRHYSHIRMEAKRNALEAIVKPGKRDGEEAESEGSGEPKTVGYPQSENDCRNGGEKTEKSRVQKHPQISSILMWGTHKSPHNLDFQGVVWGVEGS